MSAVMTKTSPLIVLKIVQSVLSPASLAIVIIVLTSRLSAAQTFRGPYIGVEVGRQHVIAGSLVDGVDTLQQDSRAVVTAFGGLRLQRAGFVVGGDLGLGRMDGDLRLDDQSTSIGYQGNSQWRWSLHGGRVFGARTLVFGYLSEVTRKFDVTITRGGVESSQQDEQGMLRFGGGIEFQVKGPWHITATAGSSRADFGGRPTNIDIGRRLEIAAGLTVQF
jgi:hypothetical protein